MSDELDLLIERFLAGGATEEECARLENLLAKDPDALGRFLLDLDQDVSLRKLLAPEGVPKVEADESPRAARRVDRSRRRLFGTAHARPTLNAWGGALAAAAVITLSVLLISLLGSNPRRDEGDEARARERNRIRRREEARLELGRSLGERRRAQEQLDDLDRERQRLVPPEASPLKDPEAQKVRLAEIARLEARRHAIEDEMRLALDREARARETLERPQESPSRGQAPELPSPGIPPGQTAARETTPPPALILDAVQGEAFIVTASGASPALAGNTALAGQGLETRGPESRIVAKFADGTRLELGPRTLIQEVFDPEPPGRGARGRRLYLAQGTLSADVRKQPPDQPLVVATPQAQAKVMGTTLRLTVEGGEKGQTRLVVKEGKVRLTRGDGRFVDVGAGYEAQAGPGAEFASRPQDPSAAVPRSALALWFRADQGVGLNGAAVSLWGDRSGNNRHALQPLAPCQPLLIRNALGGHPVLRFDGIDDHLIFPCPVTGLAGMTIFLVSSTLEERSCGVNGAGNSAIFWHETENFGTVVLTPSSSKVRFFFGTGQNQAIFSYPRPRPIDRGFSLTTALKRGTEALLFVDGRQSLRVGGQKPALAACEKVGQIGRGEGDLLTNRQFQGQFEGWTYFSGEIAEILVYARAVSEEERLSVEEYLLGKYFSK
jgi:hypothetical protein